MTVLRIYLFGSPVVELDGEPIHVDTRKAIALFAYLVVTGTSHSRDHLAALLWPEYDQSRSRAALRRTLSPLKKALGGEWLLIDRDTLSLDNRADFWLDVGAFRRLLKEVAAHDHAGDAPCAGCLAKLSSAVDLYQGDFLAGFTLRDSPAFDDWQFFETESLRKLLAEALEQLVEGYSVAGDFQTAIQFARQWSVLDPLHEGAHRHLMRLYIWSGERTAAIRQYRECVRVLDTELGVPPLDETTVLYQQIMDDQPPPPPSRPSEERSVLPVSLDTQPSTPAARDVKGYPLVGREAALESLITGVRNIRADGLLMVIEGEAGIGKTRLAMEFLTALETQGSTVLPVRCYEGETHLAYGSFVEGLRAAVQRPGAADRLQRVSPLTLQEAARLLPELALSSPDLPPPPPLEGPGGQSRFLEGLRQLIEGLCAGQPPGVLFLDDAHWADEASLDLLTYLVRRLRGLPLLILVTWRSEHVPRSHRLRSLLGEAIRSDHGKHLSLSRLGSEAVDALVESLSLQFPAPDLADRLYAETDGLPYFIVEYLDAVRKRADEANDFDWSPPDGVRDLLRSRLADVGETGRQLLTTGAVIGRFFSFDTLRSASGRSEEEAVAGLEDLVNRGLLIEGRSPDHEGLPTYDFSHQQLRQLVYAETSLARRRLLHRRIASTLLNRSRDPKEIEQAAGQIAYHYRQAGQESDAAVFYRQAGDHARVIFANNEAIAHYQTALALDCPEPGAVHEAIGDLQTLMGTYRAALTSYETAAALNGEETLPRLDHKLGIVHHRLGEWERAESYYQTASARLAGAENAESRARIYADWSLMAYRQGDVSGLQIWPGRPSSPPMRLAPCAASPRSAISSGSWLVAGGSWKPRRRILPRAWSMRRLWMTWVPGSLRLTTWLWCMPSKRRSPARTNIWRRPSACV